MAILRNESRDAQLSGIMEKGKAQDGKSMGMTASCLDRSILNFVVPVLFFVGWGPLSFGHCCDVVGSLRPLVNYRAVRSPMGPCWMDPQSLLYCTVRQIFLIAEECNKATVVQVEML
jgi:hypothetical protein